MKPSQKEMAHLLLKNYEHREQSMSITMNFDEVARELGVGVVDVRRLVIRRRLQILDLAGTEKFKTRDIEAYINSGAEDLKLLGPQGWKLLLDISESQWADTVYSQILTSLRDYKLKDAELIKLTKAANGKSVIVKAPVPAVLSQASESERFASLGDLWVASVACVELSRSLDRYLSTEGFAVKHVKAAPLSQIYKDSVTYESVIANAVESILTSEISVHVPRRLRDVNYSFHVVLPYKSWVDASRVRSIIRKIL